MSVTLKSALLSPLTSTGIGVAATAAALVLNCGELMVRSMAVWTAATASCRNWVLATTRIFKVLLLKAVTANKAIATSMINAMISTAPRSEDGGV